jgi:hypothetical protein
MMRRKIASAYCAWLACDVSLTAAATCRKQCGHQGGRRRITEIQRQPWKPLASCGFWGIAALVKIREI